MYDGETMLILILIQIPTKSIITSHWLFNLERAITLLSKEASQLQTSFLTTKPASVNCMYAKYQFGFHQSDFPEPESSEKLCTVSQQKKINTITNPTLESIVQSKVLNMRKHILQT